MLIVAIVQVIGYSSVFIIFLGELKKKKIQQKERWALACIRLPTPIKRLDLLVNVKCSQIKPKGG